VDLGFWKKPDFLPMYEKKEYINEHLLFISQRLGKIFGKTPSPTVVMPTTACKIHIKISIKNYFYTLNRFAKL
jgi:hypothetical protein